MPFTIKQLKNYESLAMLRAMLSTFSIPAVMDRNTRYYLALALHDLERDPDVLGPPQNLPKLRTTCRATRDPQACRYIRDERTPSSSSLFSLALEQSTFAVASRVT